MKNQTLSQSRGRIAFTLIELLVVIAVIGILAALLFPVMNRIQNKRITTVAYGELTQVATAIEAYHAKKGFYPPDNPNSVITNQLYWELTGSVLTTNVYTTRDGANSISTNNVSSFFGVPGFVNSSASIRGTDDAPTSESFIKELKPDQIVTVTVGAVTTKVLAASEGWDQPGVQRIAAWNYNSSHPTNNPGSYDLWVDLYIRGKTNRISNWSKEPQVLP